MDVGFWVLSMLLQIGQYEIIIKPEFLINDYQACLRYARDLKKLDGIPRACFKESEA